MTRPLSIWVVSDGRAGIENQALGLAEAIQRLTPAAITVKRIRWRRAFDRLPSALKVRDADRNVRNQRRARFGRLAHRPISTRP